MQETIVICILAVVTYTDFKERKIPNALLLLAIGVKLLFFLLENGLWGIGILNLFMDGLAISLPLWLLSELLDKLLHKRTLGGGDIKLLFVTGMYLGWEQNMWMLFLAGIIALLFVLIRREKEVPLGPAIAIATACMLLLENTG